MSVRQREYKDPETGKVSLAWMVDVDFTHASGKRTRVRKVSPVQTKSGAKEYERQVRQELLAGTFGRKEQEQTRQVPTFGAFADDFVTNYAVANNKPSAVLAKKMILRVHLKPAFGDWRLSEIDQRSIEAYKSAKVEAGAHPKTINTHLAVLGRALRVAVEWGLLNQAPKVKLLREPKPPFDYFGFDEAERFLSAAEPGLWRTMFLVAMRTGLRPGELRALRWRDVDLEVGRINVRVSEVNGILGTPKDHEERQVDLSDDALKALRDFKHNRSERVFCHSDGRKLTEEECRAPLRRACKRAGLRRVTMYTFRHTFASHLVMRGAPLKVVQELMGHANIQMTMRYAHLSPESKRDAVRLLDQPASPAAL